METRSRKRARSEPDIASIPIHGHPLPFPSASPPKRHRRSSQSDSNPPLPPLLSTRRSHQELTSNRSSDASSTSTLSLSSDQPEEAAKLTEFVIDRFKRLSLDDLDRTLEPFNNDFVWGSPFLEPFTKEGLETSRHYNQCQQRVDHRTPPIVRKDLRAKTKGESGSDNPGEPLTFVKFCGTEKGWIYKYQGMDEDLLEWERRLDRGFSACAEARDEVTSIGWDMSALILTGRQE